MLHVDAASPEMRSGHEVQSLVAFSLILALVSAESGMMGRALACH